GSVDCERSGVDRANRSSIAPEGMIDCSALRLSSATCSMYPGARGAAIAASAFGNWYAAAFGFGEITLAVSRSEAALSSGTGAGAGAGFGVGSNGVGRDASSSLAFALGAGGTTGVSIEPAGGSTGIAPPGETS